MGPRVRKHPGLVGSTDLGPRALHIKLFSTLRSSVCARVLVCACPPTRTGSTEAQNQGTQGKGRAPNEVTG